MNLNKTLPDSMRGLQATFFQGPKPVFNEDNLTQLQDFYTVSKLDLDWGDRAPGTDVPTDNFSAIFEGQLMADQAGTQDYTLYLNTGDDEEVRLYVGGQKLIDTWDAPAAGELQTQVSLTGGAAEDIRLEYREGEGDAELKLEWEAEGLARQVISDQNLVRHGFGAVDESDLLTIQVATDGNNDFELIQSPTPADYDAISGHVFSSIQDAVNQAEALMNTGQGVKILIEPGDYRVSAYDSFGIVLGDRDARDAEGFDLNEQGRKAPLVIEGTAPGVRILGSQQWQDGWQEVGNGVYKHTWTEDWGFEIEMPSNPPSNPLLHRREAVFVGGDRLDPVLIQATTYDRASDTYTFGEKINPTQDLQPGQFTVDEAEDALYFKLPQGATLQDPIEVAQAEQLFRAREPNSNLVLRNLEFAYAATRYARDYAFAAVEIGGIPTLPDVENSQNIVIEDVSIHSNSGTGLRLRTAEDVTIRDSTFEGNGAAGISTWDLNGVVLHDIDAEYNNWRGNLGNYRGWFVAGIKNHQAENITADNFNASNNYAHGYWHDLNVKNTLFNNGTVENNSRNGLFIEVSDGPHQVIDSTVRDNGESGVIINTSPHVFLQGNDIANNASGGAVEGRQPAPDVDTDDGEIRIGARPDREATNPNLPDIVDNTTLIDNVIQNTSDSTNNELIAIYANPDRYQDLLQNELVANHNVYWDKTGEPVFDLRYDKNIRFSEADAVGDRWIDVSQRDDFEAQSVFERPKTGKAKPSYTGSFNAALEKGQNIVLTPEYLAVSDPDTYAFDLDYTLNTLPTQGSLRLRGVSLSEGDSFSLADVERGWVSYTHEANNQIDDSLTIEVSDRTHVLSPQALSLTIGAQDTPEESFGLKAAVAPAAKRKPARIPTAGLVAELNLDENTGTVAADGSQQGLNNFATLVDDASWTTGVQQGAVALDGQGDAMRLRNSADINLDTYKERTLSLWFKVDESANLTGQKQLIYEEGARYRGLNAYLEDDQLYVGGWNTPEKESDWQGTWLSTDDFLINEWNHLSVVLEGNNSVAGGAFRGYLNGEQFGEGEGSQLWEHSGGIGLGSVNRGTRFHDGTLDKAQSLSGAIDEVLIFNDALNASQIQTLATAPGQSS